MVGANEAEYGYLGLNVEAQKRKYMVHAGYIDHRIRTYKSWSVRAYPISYAYN